MFRGMPCDFPWEDSAKEKYQLLHKFLLFKTIIFRMTKETLFRFLFFPELTFSCRLNSWKFTWKEIEQQPWNLKIKEIKNDLLPIFSFWNDLYRYCFFFFRGNVYVLFRTQENILFVKLCNYCLKNCLTLITLNYVTLRYVLRYVLNYVMKFKRIKFKWK